MDKVFKRFVGTRLIEISGRGILYAKNSLGGKNIKRILGGNLVALIFASSILPSSVYSDTSEEKGKEEAIIATQIGVRNPVARIKINQGFRFFHPGVDLDGEKGDPIRPVMPGKVISISKSRAGYGNAIVIDHGGKVTSLYAHLSEVAVEVDDEVATDTVIGKMGSSGRSTGPHLHLEIRESGKPINPLSVLPR